MKIILGIDPGSRITGYGIIGFAGQQFRYLDSGCIRLKTDSLGEKCATIFDCINQLVNEYKPTHAAIESVFVSKNPNSAIKLGQARGAAIAAAARQGIEIAEYAPRKVKLAVVGTGSAEKEQVSHMVIKLLGLSDIPQVDAGDALAVALCHAFSLPKYTV